MKDGFEWYIDRVADEGVKEAGTEGRLFRCVTRLCKFGQEEVRRSKKS